MVDTVEVNTVESPTPTLEESLKIQEAKNNPPEPFVMPEKFVGKTPEEIAKSYVELEKMRNSSNKPPEDTPTSDDNAGDTSNDDTDSEDEGTGDTTNVPTGDFSKYTEELQANNELSDASYKEIQDTYGFDKKFVDKHIEGQKAADELHWQKISKDVGGKDKLIEMVTWANESFNPEEITTLDDALKGNDYQRKLALTDLQNRFKSAHGQPTFVDGKGSGSQNIHGYRDMHEVKAAMADPRYGADARYRNEVIEKMKHSPNI